jgi:hypothetical protein
MICHDILYNHIYIIHIHSVYIYTYIHISCYKSTKAHYHGQHPGPQRHLTGTPKEAMDIAAFQAPAEASETGGHLAGHWESWESLGKDG